MLLPGSRAPWTTVSTRPLPELEEFLRDHEPAATAISDRYRRDRHRSRTRRGGRVHFWDAHAAVYQGSGGLLLPCGLDAVKRSSNATAALRRSLGVFNRTSMMMGPGPDVETLEEMLSLHPADAIVYDLLYLKRAAFPECTRPPIAGLAISRPRPEEWRSLLQLQIAYEVEEVLLPGREQELNRSRATLVDSLQNQLVLVATLHGTVVGRVATNARGFGMDQIGGVYTAPAWRGRGVARWLMQHLLALLREEGRDATLFVKHNNAAAQALYRGLGFRFVSPFRISYYP